MLSQFLNSQGSNALVQVDTKTPLKVTEIKHSAPLAQKQKTCQGERMENAEQNLCPYGTVIYSRDSSKHQQERALLSRYIGETISISGKMKLNLPLIHK